MAVRLYVSLLPLELKRELLKYISPLEVYEKCQDLLLNFCYDEKYWKSYSEAIKQSNIIFRPEKLWLKEVREKMNYLSTISAYPTIYWLNFLGPYYYGGAGFFNNVRDREGFIYGAKGIDRYINLYKLNILTSLTFSYTSGLPPNIANEMKQDTDDTYKKFYNYLTTLDPNDIDSIVYIYNLNPEILQKLAAEPIPYYNVTIKYTEDNWYGKPKQWYNSTKYILPQLSSKTYIKVKEPFMEVTISENKKKAPITLDDILFATRALMVDSTRTADKYYIISEISEELILEPKIDNYST